MPRRRTKIVATLGPATDAPSVMDAMIDAGVDVARINMSHGKGEDQLRRARLVRERAALQRREIAIMADLQGPKIRIESFRGNSVNLPDGAVFTLDAAMAADAGDQGSVGMTYKALPRDVSPGDILLLDDGNIRLEVESVEGEAIRTRVQIGGVLSNQKGINRLGGGLTAEALTDKDRNDIRIAGEMGADYLAVSFPRNADDIHDARARFHAAGGTGGIVAKMERTEAVVNMDAIIQASDAIMIARGDLGVEIGDAELPGVQKLMISRARALNGVTITATHMMQSMVESAQPTRAEVMDVANAVLDGTDAVMLSAETAVGRHPPRVIEAMDRICLGAERQRAAMVSKHRIEARFETTEEAIAMAAMYTANHLEVAAIMALTESGMTARWMSRISSGIPVFAMTRRIEAQRRMSLYRGVYPVNVDLDSTDEYRVDRTVIDVLTGMGAVGEGDRIIITRGNMTGVAGGTNTMKIVRVGDPLPER